MAYQSKARTTRTTTTASTQSNQPTTVAWMNLSVVTADGREVPLQGIPLNVEKHLHVQLLKSMGVTNVTFDEQGNPVFDGPVDTDKVFNLVAKVNLVKPAEDYQF